ncbi:MAG TPA: hypothetical protein PKD68_05530, partial [Candidatus Saccharibacteria bacterium]|nr:hypothetical protein [Candidatus Saccharibacteria bacterium]
MEVLVVANINLGENEGIYKKIVAEATALGQILGSAKAVLRRGNEAVYLEMPSGRIISRSEKSIYRFALEIVRSARCDILYVRHARPSVTLLNLLKAAAKGHTEAVIYEIPTYPYFAEQLRASRAKHRAVAKIGIDIFFWPFIYRYVDHLFVVRSRRST